VVWRAIATHHTTLEFGLEGEKLMAVVSLEREQRKNKNTFLKRGQKYVLVENNEST
jgi:hypothetical protein